MALEIMALPPLRTAAREAPATRAAAAQAGRAAFQSQAVPAATVRNTRHHPPLAQAVAVAAATDLRLLWAARAAPMAEPAAAAAPVLKRAARDSRASSS